MPLLSFPASAVVLVAAEAEDLSTPFTHQTCLQAFEIGLRKSLSTLEVECSSVICPVPLVEFPQMSYFPPHQVEPSWLRQHSPEPLVQSLCGYFQGEKDWMKFETARKLKKRLPKIRDAYKEDWDSTKMEIRQRGVALYFIDTLAFRAGNEKEKGKTADKDKEEKGETADEEEEEGETSDEEEGGETADKKEEGETACAVGCCNLRVEHVKLQEDNFVKFDFVGKSEIPYQKTVPVEKKVYENIRQFMSGKEAELQLFNNVKPSDLNKHLQTLMPGLTATVFRTCNASITLQDQLKALTVPEETVTSTQEERLKLMSQVHVEAVQAAAALLNHKCADPKKAKLKAEIKTLETNIEKTKKELESVQNEIKQSGNKKKKRLVNQESKVAERLEDQLDELEKLKAQYAKAGYKLNVTTTVNYYLDPRISVAWYIRCKKWGVDVDSVFDKAQRDKFRWAIDMAEEGYEF